MSALSARSIDRFIPDDSPLGRAGDAAMLLRATGGNLYGAAVLASLARKESSFGAQAFVPNNFWGYGIHAGPSVNRAPSVEAMARRVWQGLTKPGGYYAKAKTIGEALNIYAPPSENDTGLYKSQVNQWLASMGADPSANFRGAVSGRGAPAGPTPPMMPAGGAAAPGMDRIGMLNAIRSLHSGDPSGRLQGLQSLMAMRSQVGGAVAAGGGTGAPPAAPGAGGLGANVYAGPLANIPSHDVPFGTAPNGGYAWAENIAKAFGVSLTSGYRNAAQQIATGSRAGLRSRHLVHGGAADISGSPDAMRRLADWAIRSGRFAEVFYDPVGQWDNGRFSSRGIGGHSDHVHLSYGRPVAGYLPRERR